MPRKTLRNARESATRVVGYCRVSTADQALEGVSLDDQRERLAAYAVAHQAELVVVELDEGISGKVPPEKRPGLARALDRVRSGEVDGIVAIRLDRLSRSVRDVLDLAEDAQRHGWRLVSMTEHLDTGTPTGRFTLTILAALAQLEREQISQRTSEALAYVGREGRARSRWTPYGWRNADGRAEQRSGDRRPLAPHAEEQAALKRILRFKRRGKGAKAIARSLNARSGANPRTGRAWSWQSVASILRTVERREECGAAVLVA